ncbi:RhoGAP domain containing protein [Trichomonas vaginalis G3]|uniref:RhoGAP domain containing protein n=1 Tax=Trichomonas vaginalis (strain ATCC PRA-98 / G3) TaxID=412133 RepID=A2DMP5_TRIV3|nr:GTPase activator protein [Trichomonas vaginalis G3]EAY18266.1 RhoGAP domain containing protein [Trichomonas vaginalis G3]KAI5541913.1 GTPase activator protein [Trichomonas vaginalis G3]|eukprot:XP_001579252.1 RhoGAP domain containing protein [Trichomonas vaginalis G3]
MPVWGQSLVSLALTYQRAVPKFLEEAFEFIIKDHLDQEGLFRMAGNDTEIKAMISKIDILNQLQANKNTNPYNVCVIINRFLRDIPGHLFIDSNAQAFQKCTTPTQVKDIIRTLPVINRAVISRLFGFLCMVAKHSDKNKMTALNLSIVMAPNLVDDASNATFLLNKDVVLLMIKEYAAIFDDMSSLDSNGNWISDDAFSQITGNVVSAFLCQSSFMMKPLTPIKVEKQARMIRNVRIEISSLDHIMNDLLSINPSPPSHNVIQLTKL